MSTEEKKSSLLIYVGDFIEKHDNQLGEKDDLKAKFDKDLVIIKTDNQDYQHTNLDNRTSGSSNIDFDGVSLNSDPIVEIHESSEQTYKQKVYVCQYQPPTPIPIEIQVQEILVKPQIEPSPIHVHVNSKKNRVEQRTPSPIYIKTAPPELSSPSSHETIFYNKYIPVNYKPPPRQIVIHQYPKLPPKPRPIVIEQWLPTKPPPKRVTYRSIDHDELVENEFKRKRNRYIEYKKPHTIIEVEIIRLPVIKLNPKEYHNRSNRLTQLDYFQSLSQDLDLLRWRI